MKKVILLNINGLNARVGKWLFIVLGAINMYNGISDLMRVTSPQRIAFAVSVLLAGLLVFILAFYLFNPESRISPKIIFDDEQITIRERVYNRPKSVKWADIREIGYSAFTLDFHLHNNSQQSMKLITSPDTSKEVKKVLREMAKQRSIAVVGG